jgi:hypothetical protein
MRGLAGERELACADRSTGAETASVITSRAAAAVGANPEFGTVSRFIEPQCTLDAVTIETVADQMRGFARRMGMGCLVAVGLRILLLGCLLVSVATVMIAWRHLWFAFNGVTVEGLVVRQAEELAADWDDPSAGKRISGVQMAPARRLYRAIVEFGSGERSYSIEAQARGPADLYPVGSRVDVVYARGRPDGARLKPELPDFWTQAGYLLMGTVLGAGAVYWWWKLLRRRAKLNLLPDGRMDVSGG